SSDVCSSDLSDVVEDEERIVQPEIELVRPNYPGGSRFYQFHRHRYAAGTAPQNASREIVDIEPPGSVLRSDTLLGKCEYRASGDDEKAPQLGKPGDDVVGKSFGQAGLFTRPVGLDEGHDGKRSPVEGYRLGRRCGCCGPLLR